MKQKKLKKKKITNERTHQNALFIRGIVFIRGHLFFYEKASIHNSMTFVFFW